MEAEAEAGDAAQSGADSEAETDASGLDDECSVCYELLCEPVRWPSSGTPSSRHCVHFFCKPCICRWGTQMGEDAGCPLCRAPAAKLLSRPSALVVDEAEARRIAARHPDAYAERLKHNRELSRELLRGRPRRRLGGRLRACFGSVSPAFPCHTQCSPWPWPV